MKVISNIGKFRKYFIALKNESQFIKTTSNIFLLTYGALEIQCPTKKKCSHCECGRKFKFKKGFSGLSYKKKRRKKIYTQAIC